MVRARRTLQNKLAGRKLLCSAEEGALWHLHSPTAPRPLKSNWEVTPFSETANDKKPSGRSHRARPGQASPEHRASGTADIGGEALAAEDTYQQCHCLHVSPGLVSNIGPGKRLSSATAD